MPWKVTFDLYNARKFKTHNTTSKYFLFIPPACLHNMKLAYLHYCTWTAIAVFKLSVVCCIKLDYSFFYLRPNQCVDKHTEALRYQKYGLINNVYSKAVGA